MAAVVKDAAEWARMNFSDCRLGDDRRTRRAVRVAAQVAGCPDGSTPRQTENWADCKAAYRLFGEDDVTFRALAEPHWRLTRQAGRGTCLLIGDTTEAHFHGEREGLGPVGDGIGRGFFLHNCLMVEADSEELIGVAGQELFYRRPAPTGDNSYRRTQRPRESEVWGRLIEQIGPPPTQCRYIHVFDAGADNLEVYCRLGRTGCGWVVRAAQLGRRVEDAAGTSSFLKDLLNTLPILGTYELEVRGLKPGRRRKERAGRVAKLEVRAGAVTLPRQKRRSPYLKSIGFESLSQFVVEVREVDPPKGQSPLSWVLYTSEEVRTFEDARRVIGYYEKRWLIEEYHKALKTGCRLEDRQYAEAGSLEAVAGLFSVVAVRLVQLKTIARHEPDRPAESVVPRRWIQMLSALRKRRINTVGEFFRHLGGLGGHLGRRRDGLPGWQTLWRGLDKLTLCLRGAETRQKKCG